MKLATACLAFALVVGLAIEKTWADDNEEGNTTEASTTPQSISTTVAPAPSKTTQKPAKSSGKKVQDVAPPILECPAFCECQSSFIICKDSNKWKALPNLSKFTTVTSVAIHNTSIIELDFNLLPLAIEKLSLSRNNISRINSSKVTLPQLKSIDLSENQLRNLTSLAPSTVKLPAIEELVLSLNPIEEIPGPAVFNIFKNLKLLKLDGTKLKTIHETAFNYLTELKTLDMSNNRLTSHLGLRQFANNQKLTFVDLTNNSLIEVPFALRSTSSIETLVLERNLFTSLRKSDFTNQTSLKSLFVRNCPNLTKIDEHSFDLPKLTKLYLDENPKLSSISKDAFKSDIVRNIQYLDLSGNNFTTLFDPVEFSSVRILHILLNNNPWHCDCDLEWIKKLETKNELHCKTPLLYHNMEVGYFLSTIDCEQEKSSYHVVILTLFLLFLFGLAVAVFVQKSEICRRFFSRDQHGTTIYYTKANFNPESV